MNAPRWQLDVIRPGDGRRKAWGIFDTRAAAEIERAKLAKVGMYSLITRIEEQPEHNNDRRRFLMWALMIGATTPAVVAERIVAEVEAQDA